MQVLLAVLTLPLVLPEVIVFLQHFYRYIYSLGENFLRLTFVYMTRNTPFGIGRSETEGGQDGAYLLLGRLTGVDLPVVRAVLIISDLCLHGLDSTNESQWIR